jgi:prefoldin beta subunit
MSNFQTQIQQQFMRAATQYNEYNAQVSKNSDEITQTRQNEATILAQLNENQIVKKELDLVGEDGDVYKLIGPVLVKQETFDANSNVEKRIEFLQREESKLQKRAKELEEENISLYQKMAGIQKWIVQVQQQMAQMQQQA